MSKIEVVPEVNPEDQEKKNPEVELNEGAITKEVLLEQTGFDNLADLMADVNSLREQQKPTPEPEVKPASVQNPLLARAIEIENSGGDGMAFLSNAQKDYNEIPPETLVKMMLSEETGLTGSDLDDIFEVEFGQSEDLTEIENKRMRVKMLRKAKEYRDVKIAEQKKLITSDVQTETKTGVKPVDESATDFDAWEKHVDSVSKGLLESKKVTLKVGDDDFKYEVGDPEKFIAAAKDPGKMMEFFVEGEGNDAVLNVERMYLAMAVASDLEGFVKAILTNGKVKGKDAILKEIKNPTVPGSGGKPASNGGGDGSVAAQMLRAALKQNGKL